MNHTEKELKIKQVLLLFLFGVIVIVLVTLAKKYLLISPSTATYIYNIATLAGCIFATITFKKTVKSNSP
jgi:hypothetical protein